jgi:UDPglucose--hexose-1-phosphate uridylyltransferase
VFSCLEAFLRPFLPYFFHNFIQKAMAEQFQFTQHSHRRFNPLTNSWVLCSPHRTQRPWQGAQESANAPALPEYDPKCYLCPGNTRANGESNPAYKTTFAFPNDFPAVKADQPEYKEDQNDAQGKYGVGVQGHWLYHS